jgi:hypothetical protein
VNEPTITPDATGREFLTDIVRLYHGAQAAKTLRPNVMRSRAKSVSSDAEDVFAIHIGTLLPDDYELWVDVALNALQAKKETRRIQPDIVILNERGQIADVIDLKMDLGWSRGEEQKMLNKASKWMENAKRPKGVKSGWGDKSYYVAADARFHIAVITQNNSGETPQLTGTDHASLWTFAGEGWHPNKTVAAGEHMWTVEEKMTELGASMSDDFEKLVQHLRRKVKV